MASYTDLKRENVYHALENKPRWMVYLIVAVSVITITTSAVAAGAFIGYTYCYLEHRHAMVAGNVTQSTNFQIMHIPFQTKISETKNRTINSAISSVLVSRIFKFGPALVEEEKKNLKGADPGLTHKSL